MAVETAPPGTGAGRLPIALDASGGDRAPEQPVAAGVRAVRELGIPVTLVGRAAEVERLVRALGGPFPGLTVVDAPEVVQMEEHAVAAVRRKARASITVAVEELKQGRAAAVVSAGHSGAVVASALFGLGRLPGVERPALAIPFPRLGGGAVWLLDAGAVVDPRPAHLVEYARLATAFLRHTEHLAAPRIGLLSNGEEAGKGNSLVRETYQLLADAPDVHFVGNVEGNAIPTGVADAVVCDGFTGNVVLKTAEGMAALIQDSLRAELGSRWSTKIPALLLRPAFRRVARRLDYREYGGVPLLGVNGVVVVAHGRSDATALMNAIAAAHRAAASGLIEGLRAGMTASTVSPGEAS
ncbi:MAG: phosphate acyltransferase PlsX [Sphaerobacter sp.]|nr:phosphate acyltransferase PlsX [Sphaerobacter sp.]